METKSEVVDHSTVGAQHAHDVFDKGPFETLLAYPISGHHGGLLDYFNADHASFDQRLNKTGFPNVNNTLKILPKEKRTRYTWV